MNGLQASTVASILADDLHSSLRSSLETKPFSLYWCTQKYNPSPSLGVTSYSGVGNLNISGGIYNSTSFLQRGSWRKYTKKYYYTLQY